jgi:mono/diheme cytochrome c family protein
MSRPVALNPQAVSLACFRLVRLLVVAFGTATVGWAASVEAPDFVRDVQPLLAEHCVKCHGPENRREAIASM